MNPPCIDHIGIGVRDLDEASSLFRDVLGVEESHREELPGEGVAIAIFELGATKIELITPLDEENPISKFLATKGPGILHLAIRTPHLEAHYGELREKGFQVTGKIRSGGEGRKVFFLHPKQTSGVLLEFTSPPPHESDG